MSAVCNRDSIRVCNAGNLIRGQPAMACVRAITQHSSFIENQLLIHPSIQKRELRDLHSLRKVLEAASVRLLSMASNAYGHRGVRSTICVGAITKHSSILTSQLLNKPTSDCEEGIRG